MADSPSESADSNAIYAKVGWRLVPFLFVCYVIAYLDRVNVGFAKLQMAADLHLSDTVYGLGAGVFFIGYFAFEVPSNIILHRVGAKRWIARIMITWGILSAATMFVSGPVSFYAIRFLLGLGEAGFFPGVILYLTYWYPARRRARITAIFMAAVPMAGVVGGPFSGWIMQTLAGSSGWRGWQWLFLLEGIPSIIAGVATLFVLDDSITKAKWLSEAEKKVLQRELEDDAPTANLSLRDVFRDGRVWLLSAIYFCIVMGVYGIGFWLPTIIKATGVKGPLDVGLLTAIPYSVSIVAMVFTARRADRTGERRWHVAVPALLGGLGLLLSAVFGSSTTAAMAALTLATAGIMTTLPLFWSLPTAFLGGTAAAAGIALVNSVGNLAGFVSPYLIGYIKDVSHSMAAGMYVLAASLVLGGVLVIAAIPAKLVNR
jgi:D-galactonate transporter